MNKFPLDFFPDNLQNVIKDVCDSYKYNPEFLSCAILSTAATALGNSYHINVNGAWKERASFYIAIVGSRGTAKTHPITWALKPIQEREKRQFKEYKKMCEAFDSDDSKAHKEPPPLIKTILMDATPESVVRNLSKNDRGCMIYNDELAGFLNSFQRYNKGNDEPLYLSLWSGVSQTVDRVTSRSIRIENPMLNIIGTIQHEPLDKSFEGKEESGFYDRWLICHPSNLIKEYWSMDKPNPSNEKTYFDGIERLLDRQMTVNDYGDPEPRYVNYSQEALELIFEWQRENTDAVNSTDDETVKGIRAKIEIYVHRFALICHMLEYSFSNSFAVEQFVSKQTAKKAIKLCSYFIKSALSIRASSPEDRLTDDFKNLYIDLPNESNFTTSEAITRGQFYGITEIRIKRWLKKQEGKLITKIKHGTYSKK